jgi:hypothetical protein
MDASVNNMFARIKESIKANKVQLQSMDERLCAVEFL